MEKSWRWGGGSWRSGDGSWRRGGSCRRKGGGWSKSKLELIIRFVSKKALIDWTLL